MASRIALCFVGVTLLAGCGTTTPSGAAELTTLEDQQRQQLFRNCWKWFKERELRGVTTLGADPYWVCREYADRVISRQPKSLVAQQSPRY